MRRNSYLISKAFSNFLVAAILTSIASQFCILTDGIIVSNFVAPEALSALNLSSPIMNLLFSLIPLMCTGASIVAAKSIGSQNYGETSRIFSVALFSCVGFLMFFSLSSSFFSEEIALLLCSEQTIYPYLLDYLRVFLPGSVVYGISMCLNLFVSVDGNPGLVTKAMITTAVSNIILDLLFVICFGFGIQGAAIASILGTVLGIVVLFSHLFGKNCSFKLINPLTDFSRVFGANLKQGIPFMVSGLMTAAIFFFINSITLHTLGAKGVFILSICVQILMFSYLGLNGAGSAILSIGGVVVGEKDMNSLRILVNNSMRFMMTVVGSLTLFVLVFPDSVIGLFGADTPELLNDSILPIRLFVIGLVPMGICMILRFLYQLLGYLTASTLFAALQMLLLIPSLWIFSKINPDYMWLAFPVAFLSLLLLQFVYARIKSSKHPGMTSLTLIPKEVDNLSFELSLKYDKEDVEQGLRRIDAFMTEQRIGKEVVNKVLLCSEELLLNLITYARNKNDKRTFDMRIKVTNEKIHVSLKDDGRPFNPIYKYQEEGRLMTENENELKLGLAIVNGVCEDLNYKFMYGQNMLYLNFERE